MYLSRSDIERIAQRVLRGYAKLPVVQGKELWAISPENLLQDLMGMKIGYLPLSVDGSILGLTTYDPLTLELCAGSQMSFYVELDGKTVLIDAELQDSELNGRRNFTLMHEASHHILKMLFPAVYGNTEEERALTYYRDPRRNNQWIERQCDALASALLLPEELILKYMNQLGLPTPLPMLNSIFRKEWYNGFVYISRALGASKQALSIRMQQLGLIEKNYFCKPNDACNIYVGGDF